MVKSPGQGFLLWRRLPGGNRSRVTNQNFHFVKILLSTLDPASAVFSSKKRAKNMPAAFDSRTQVKQFTCLDVPTQNTPEGVLALGRLPGIVLTVTNLFCYVTLQNNWCRGTRLLCSQTHISPPFDSGRNCRRAVS